MRTLVSMFSVLSVLVLLGMAGCEKTIREARGPISPADKPAVASLNR